MLNIIDDYTTSVCIDDGPQYITHSYFKTGLLLSLSRTMPVEMQKNDRTKKMRFAHTIYMGGIKNVDLQPSEQHVQYSSCAKVKF